MVKFTDVDKRRNEILASTVELYLNTASPVGSNLLCSKSRFECSSATIRNVLAELEEMELLTHPHTSAGRIPTDKGYRYYLDFLMDKSNLSKQEKSWVKRIYENRIKKIDDIVEEASRIISELTHYASIVWSSSESSKIIYSGLSYIVEQPEFNSVEKIKVLFRLLEEKQRLLDLINKDFDEDVKVYVGRETEFDDLDDCSLVVSRTNRRSKEINRLAVLGPKRMAYNKVIPLVNYVSELISEILDEW